MLSSQGLPGPHVCELQWVVLYGQCNVWIGFVGGVLSSPAEACRFAQSRGHHGRIQAGGHETQSGPELAMKPSITLATCDPRLGLWHGQPPAEHPGYAWT